jgi:hypothetical protein
MRVGSRGEAARKALQEEWITLSEITEEDLIEDAVSEDEQERA